MTNADKIRTMTDEELAELLMCDCERCEFQLYDQSACNGQCYDGAVKWLKRECEEDEGNEQR